MIVGCLTRDNCSFPACSRRDHGLVFRSTGNRLGIALIGSPSITICIRHNTTSINVINGSILVRRTPNTSICRIVSLNVNHYHVTITNVTNGGISVAGHVAVNAGCPHVTHTCFRTGRRDISVVGLGKSIRLTPVINLSSIVISVIRANGALGTGNLRILGCFVSFDTHVVYGPISFGVGCSRVRRLVRIVHRRDVGTWLEKD